MLFGAIALYAFLIQWHDIVSYASDDGVLPLDVARGFLRTAHRFSLLDTFSTAPEVFGLYLLLLSSLVCVTIGILTTPALLLSVILIASVHERAIFTLEGGDTVMRLTGFLLLLSPCGRTMSVAQLCRRLRSLRRAGHDLPSTSRPLPVWPRRLLLWQLVVLYVSSAWTKALGSTWWAGSATSYALHHDHFQRFSDELISVLDPLGPLLTWSVLAWEALWLLIPLQWALGLVTFGSWHATLRRLPIARALLLTALFFHAATFLLMDVGIFSLILLSPIIGALSAADLEAIRNWWNRSWRKRWGGQRITVLYDGRCGLCRRAMLVLSMCDWLQRLLLVDFTDPEWKRRHAPGIDLSKLEEAMHVMLPQCSTENGLPADLSPEAQPAHRRVPRSSKSEVGSLGEGGRAKGEARRAQAGFDAFRAMSWHLPPLWVLVPLLYVPGVAPIGRRIYSAVAARRVRCAGGVCTHTHSSQ